MEVLAPYRKDPALQAEQRNLTGDARDHLYPTLPAGEVPADWLARRAAATASLAGRHIVIGADETLGWLQHHVPGLPIQYGLPEFDGAAIRQATVRPFTQALSRWLYEHDAAHGTFDGVQFESRHGDRLTLWATFERSNDGDTSQHVTGMNNAPLAYDDPDVQRALNRH